MEIKSFKSYLVEDTKDITFVFGRFNPPTTGHELLFDKLKKVSKGSYRIYASQSQDANKNPFDFKTKVKILRKMFPKHARSVMADKGIRTAMDVAVSLYDQGYTKVSMVAGDDRVKEFEILLNKYNGVDARHGFYQFEGGLKVISAGQRDPDSDDVSGMSASKMRKAAKDNDLSSFSKGVPSSYKDVQGLFNMLRKAMGLKESNNFRQHIQLDPVSETREEYIDGTLFEIGDTIIVKETNEQGTIKMLGSNYVTVQLESGTKRVWLDDIALVENCGGVGEDKVTQKYQKVTPNEKVSKKKKKKNGMTQLTFRDFKDEL